MSQGSLERKLAQIQFVHVLDISYGRQTVAWSRERYTASAPGRNIEFAGVVDPFRNAK